MADESAHETILYFLEVLINNGPRSISQLAVHFGNRAFGTDMISASNGNGVKLREFLLRYPSLFTVNGYLVSLNESGTAPPVTSGLSSTSSQPITTRHSTDLSTETEAVLFFQGKLAKKDEKWVPIASLAGHLSQANENIRQCTGPQHDFKRFLSRHLHVFEVQGELVSLRDSLLSASRKFDNTFAPKSLAARPSNRKFTTRSHSSPSNPSETPTVTSAIPQTLTSTSGKQAPMTMTANEYKAVMFLKNIVETRETVKLHDLTEHFSQAPEGVQNTIGCTKMELKEFVLKNQNIFSIDEDESVTVKKSPKMQGIITGSRPQIQAVQTLTAGKGKVFHVAKFWGIIDLGEHEHVFFDKSIYPKDIDGFQSEFTVGEVLNFHAVLAPKESRSKWRATRVWRDGETASLELASPNLDGISDYGVSVSPTKGRPTLMLNENGNASDENKEENKEVICTGDTSGKKMINVACQTMSTGEILTTQMYHEGVSKDSEIGVGNPYKKVIGGLSSDNEQSSNYSFSNAAMRRPRIELIAKDYEGNKSLSDESVNLELENERIRMEVANRSPLRYGRFTVAALQTNVEKYEKQVKQLQKALERGDTYIEQLQNQLQALTGKSELKMDNKRKLSESEQELLGNQAKKLFQNDSSDNIPDNESQNSDTVIFSQAAENLIKMENLIKKEEGQSEPVFSHWDIHPIKTEPIRVKTEPLTDW